MPLWKKCWFILIFQRNKSVEHKGNVYFDLTGIKLDNKISNSILDFATMDRVTNENIFYPSI